MEYYLPHLEFLLEFIMGGFDIVKYQRSSNHLFFCPVFMTCTLCEVICVTLMLTRVCSGIPASVFVKVWAALLCLDRVPFLSPCAWHWWERPRAGTQYSRSFSFERLSLWPILRSRNLSRTLKCTCHILSLLFLIVSQSSNSQVWNGFNSCPSLPSSTWHDT